MKKALTRAFVGTVAIATLGGLSAMPAGAVSKNGQVEVCETGEVIVHTNGNAVWAESGDAKYQLVSIDGHVEGVYLDKKTGLPVNFSFDFSKTWTSGKKDVAITCQGTHQETGPGIGEYANETFTATLRQVQ